MRVKDRVPTSMKSNMVYCVPCSCGKVYIGETVRRLETRIKEHEDACKKGTTEKSAIAKHAWTTNHAIEWNETTVLDQARRRKELMIKEALHISLTPENQRLNRDGGLELPACWTAILKVLHVGRPLPGLSK